MTKSFDAVYNGECYLKGQIARAYNVSLDTLNEWLEMMEEKKLIDQIGRKRLLTPIVIRALIKLKGEPNWNNV